MSDPMYNGNGNAHPLPSETENNNEALDILLEGFELLEQRLEGMAQNVLPPALELTDDQRARLGDIFVARYAISGGIPVQAALEIAGLNVTVEPPPMLSPQQPEPPQQQPDQQGQQQPDQQQQNNNGNPVQQDEPDATTKALQNILRRIEMLVEREEGEWPDEDDIEDSGSDSAGYGSAPADEQEGTEEFYESDDRTDDSGTRSTDAQERDPARHRTRGRAVRDVGANSGGSRDEG